MTNDKLMNLFNEIFLNGLMFSNDKIKGKTRYTFYSWVNTRGLVTIKTRGIQKSFNISNKKELEKELRQFEII